MLDVRSSDLPWRSQTIPGSSPDVALARLHVDATSKATVSVVRFPPAWSRPGTGHYGCAELFVVLEGILEVSGVSYVEGEYGYLPAGTARTDSRSRGGCLAVAWFSGPPAWSRGEAALPPAEVPGHGPVAELASAGARGRNRAPIGPVDVPTEILWVESGQWCLLPAGGVAPLRSGPVLVRAWRGHDADGYQSPVP